MRFLATALLVTSLSASELPVLKTEGTQWVTITHPTLNASWRIQFPEAIGTNEAFYLVWERISVDWEKYGNGEVGYEWQAPPEWIKRSNEKVDLRGFEVTPGLRLKAQMRPSPNRIDLSLELQNLSGKPLKQVYCDGGDLQHMTARFIDKDASRTFIRTASGITRLSEIDRSHRIRCAYFFEPQWYAARRVKIWEYFWGRSKVRPTAAFIASAAADGRGAVGIGYEHSLGLMQNSDNHHCMHSMPFYGDINPEQKKLRRGVILFGSTVEELFQRFEALNYRPDSTPPVP